MLADPRVQKRIRPMMNIREALGMPQVILFPAALVSLAVVFLSIASGEFAAPAIIGATAACFVFYGLIFFVVIIPLMRARQLNAEGIETTAVVRSIESGTRRIGPLDPMQRINVPTHFVVIEFTAQGETISRLIQVELPRLPARVKEGRSMKIRYARTEPRLLRLEGE